jgi:hypothetical protein
MTSRKAWGTGLAFAVLMVLVVLKGRSGPELPQSRPVPKTVAPKPSPRVVYPLLPPPPAAPTRVEPLQAEPIVRERVPKEAAVAFSIAANRVMGDLRAECVNPWMDREGPDEAEFALNTLVVDGRVVEFELLTVIEALPDDVVACMRDVAWGYRWPEVEMAGEVRFQRSMHARRRVWEEHGD